MMSVLVIHAAATWFMVGLIWMVQIVHYPLFTYVGPGQFGDYELAHTRRMGGLLAIPAGIEVASGAALVWLRPDTVGLPIVIASGAMLVLLWFMTSLVQAPAHSRLVGSYDAGEIRRLVVSNWWRTAGWTVRGGLVAAMLLA